MISPVPKIEPLKNNYFQKQDQKKQKTKKKIPIPKAVKGTIDLYA